MNLRWASLSPSLHSMTKERFRRLTRREVRPGVAGGGGYIAVERGGWRRYVSVG